MRTCVNRQECFWSLEASKCRGQPQRLKFLSPQRKPGERITTTQEVPEARQVNCSECVELLICRASGTLYGDLILCPRLTPGAKELPPRCGWDAGITKWFNVGQRVTLQG